MKQNLHISELSSTIGINSDGIENSGFVNESQTNALFETDLTSSGVFAFKKDTSSGISSFTDVSSLAISGTPNALVPIGETATMSLGDGLLLASDFDISDFYVNITTAGVGNWNSLEIYDSTNGKTFNRQLTIIDSSNGFKNSGIQRIQLTKPTESTSFSPVPDDIPEKKWIFIRLKNFISATTAPKMSRVWIVRPDNNLQYVELTSVSNSSVTDNNFSTSPSLAMYTQNYQRIYSFPFVAYGINHHVFRKTVITPTLAYEYLASDNTWKSLQDLNDPSSGFSIGPTTLGTTSQIYNVTWSIPSDWTHKTLTFNVGGNTISSTGYFMRYRISTISSALQVAPFLVRSRVKALGPSSSGGIYHKDLETYTTITFNCGIPSTQNTIIALYNIQTGESTKFTIPANTISSSNISGQRIDLSPELTIDDSQSLLIRHVSGGTLRDLNLRLE